MSLPQVVSAPYLGDFRGVLPIFLATRPSVGLLLFSVLSFYLVFYNVFVVPMSFQTLSAVLGVS